MARVASPKRSFSFVQLHWSGFIGTQQLTQKLDRTPGKSQLFHMTPWCFSHVWLAELAELASFTLSQSQGWRDFLCGKSIPPPKKMKHTQWNACSACCNFVNVKKNKLSSVFQIPLCGSGLCGIITALGKWPRKASKKSSKKSLGLKGKCCWFTHYEHTQLTHNTLTHDTDDVTYHVVRSHRHFRSREWENEMWSQFLQSEAYRAS